MNRDDIIRMAREAWVLPDAHIPNVLEFAHLVAVAERERIKWDSIHSCHPHCDRPACVAVRRAREDEREMCAQTVESIAGDEQYRWAAMAIRERGAP